jgi:glycosyltransferase involved in cell wall biosynthesis
MNKKVFFCITKGDWGGAQKYVYDLAISLPMDRYTPTVILGQGTELKERLTEANVTTIVLDSLARDVNIKNDIRSFFQLLKIFKKERPDVIHLNSSKMGLVGALAGRVARTKKIIFTGHGWASNEDRGQWQKKILHLLHLLTIQLSTQTIAVSDMTRDQLVDENGSLRKKVVVIKNGVEKIDFLDQNQARKLLSEKIKSDREIAQTKKMWIGTIAELHKNKGLKYLIEAVHLLKISLVDENELPFFIIIGEGERRQRLEERIIRYNLQNNVFLVGKITNANKYLKAFDTFVLPSITEAMPYAVLEAGTAGLPIIASGVGGIPEIVTDMESGILVRPREPAELKSAFDFILKNPEKSKLFGDKIAEKIKCDFTREVMFKTTLALYE